VLESVNTCMTQKIHTFGCSITQGHALPDVVRPPLTLEEQKALGRESHWSDEHILAPSDYAWPKVLADRLGLPVENYARRGSCFQQIARQCAVEAKNIQPDDIVIVMWTYLTRVSLQWPARTAVPLSHLPDTNDNFRTRLLPNFNKFFGLSRSDVVNERDEAEQAIYNYIQFSMNYTFNPLAIYDRYHNSLVLQTVTDGHLRSTGARVIHLSVEHEPYLDQLERARLDLDPSLQSPYVIPNPNDWYSLSVDHDSCRIIHDPSIPTTGSDWHPSEQHHINFANHIYEQNFK
jgi:hypothetical protein